MPKAATATKKAATTKAVAEGDTLTMGENVEEVDEFAGDDWFVQMEDVPDFANVLLWGKEGAGKSTALARLANLPGPGKVLVVNAEGGLKRIALEKRGVDTSKIVLWPDPRKGQKLTRAGLERVFQKLKGDLMNDPTSWKGTGWDSITEVYQEILDAATGNRQARLKRQGKDFDPDHIDRADYGVMSKMVRDQLRKFRDLPCHYFVTALERKDKNDDGKIEIGPAVSPALATDLLGYVDMSLYMKAADEEGPYRAMTKNSVRYRVKDRFDVLPRVMVEPTGDRIVGYLLGEITEDTDPFQDDLPEKVKKSLDRKEVTEPDADSDEEGEDLNNPDA